MPTDSRIERREQRAEALGQLAARAADADRIGRDGPGARRRRRARRSSRRGRRAAPRSARPCAGRRSWRSPPAAPRALREAGWRTRRGRWRRRLSASGASAARPRSSRASVVGQPLARARPRFRRATIAWRKPAIACSTRAISAAVAGGEHRLDRLEAVEIGGQAPAGWLGRGRRLDRRRGFRAGASRARLSEAGRPPAQRASGLARR